MRHLNRYLRLPYLIGTVSSDVSESLFAAVNPQGFRDCLAALKGRTYNTTTNTITPPPPRFTNNKYSLSIYFRTAMSTGNPSGAGCMPRTRRASFKVPLFLCRRRFFLRSAHYRKGVPPAYPSSIGSISGQVFL